VGRSQRPDLGLTTAIKGSKSMARAKREPITGEMNAVEKGDEAAVIGIPITSESRHGRRARLSKGEWVQHAIMKHYHPKPVPQSVNYSGLTRDVNKLLAKQPGYDLGAVDRTTVVRAHRKLIQAQHGEENF
jgi:hypothetical protein